MEDIEKSILDLLGYYVDEEPITIGGISFFSVYDRNHYSVGSTGYEKSSNSYYIIINSPSLYFRSKRMKGSKKVKCKYEKRFCEKNNLPKRIELRMK